MPHAPGVRFWSVLVLGLLAMAVARSGFDVGADADQAHQPALFDIDGWTVAVIGFGRVVPSADWLATDATSGMADGDTIETMVAAVEQPDGTIDACLVPAFIERSGQPVLQGPHRHGCRPYRSVAANAS